jgi:alpha-amylase
MENVGAYEGGTGYGTGYHGYWVQNYYRVNAHFGSWSDVEQLSGNLHDNGMRFIQDITLNHSNPNDNHVYGRLFCVRKF